MFKRILVSLVALLSTCPTAIGEDLRVLAWNVGRGQSSQQAPRHGGDSTAIDGQVSSLDEYHLIGLTEVHPRNISRYMSAAGSDFEGFNSGSGGDDRMLIMYDSRRLRLLDTGELESHDGIRLNVRHGNQLRFCSPMFAKFLDQATNRQFLFLMNDLPRGDNAALRDQARGLRAWARDQTLPVIGGGAFNLDVIRSDRSVEGGHTRAGSLAMDSVWKSVQPTVVFDTNRASRTSSRPEAYPQTRSDSFLVAQAAKSWPARSRLLVREKDLPDSRKVRARPPVELVIDIPMSDGPVAAELDELLRQIQAMRVQLDALEGAVAATLDSRQRVLEAGERATEAVTLAGDCNLDGVVDKDDLVCANAAGVLDEVLAATGLIRGDLNGNGTVDFPDFLVLSTNFDKAVDSYVDGDINGDGMVTFPDFLVLSTNFGKSIVTTTVAKYFDDRAGAMALNYDTELYLSGMIHSLNDGYSPSTAVFRAQKSRDGWQHIMDDCEAAQIPVSFNICGPEAVFGDTGPAEYAEIDITHSWHSDPHWATNTWYSDAPPSGGNYKTVGDLSGTTRSYGLVYGGDLTERAMNSAVPFEISFHNFGHESVQQIDEATLDDTFRLGVEYHKRMGSKLTAQAPPWNQNPQPSKFDTYGQNGIFALNRRDGTVTGELYEVVENLWIVPRGDSFHVGTDLTGLIDTAISSGHVLAPYSHPEDGFESTSRTAFQNSLAYAKTKVDSGELWATTLSELARYYEAKSDVRAVTQVKEGKTIVDISLTDYDATMLGIPYLTFMSPMPDGSSHAKITVDYPVSQTLNSASSTVRIVGGTVIYTVYLNPGDITHVEIEGVASPFSGGVDINKPVLTIDSPAPVGPPEATPITIQATTVSTDAIYSVNLIFQRNNDAKVSSIMSTNGVVWESTIGPFNAGDSVSYYVSVTDHSGRRERSGDKLITVVPGPSGEAPEWRGQGQSVTIPELGTPSQLFAEGRDNDGLRYARLETDETGVWAQRPEYGSPMDMGDVAATWALSSFSWYNPTLPVGTTVSWRIRYADAAGNETVTDELSFLVEEPIVDDEPPEFFDPSVDMISIGESARFSLRWTDNVGLASYVFSFDDGNGTFQDQDSTPFTERVGEPWWDRDWSYRREIMIDNTANPDILSNHVVLITVDTASLITAGKMNPHGGDIRFIYGSEELDFWVEAGMNTGATRLWVEVPSVAASVTQQIAMYYGNPNRTVPRSSGANTFPMFDDFGGRGWEEFKFSGNPIKGPDQPAGPGTFSSVLRESDGTWKMYSSFDQSGSDIGLSTSDDGIDWVRVGVVLRKGSTGEWDSDNHWCPAVWKEGGIYYMLHPARGPLGIQMGLATSFDGRTWTKYDDPSTTDAPFAESDPVFNDPFWATGDTESPCFSVLKKNNTYYVIYDTLRSRRRSSIASSTNLINWTPVYDSPRFPGGPSTASWDHHVFCGHVFEYEDEFYLVTPGQDASRNFGKFGMYVSGSPEFPEDDTEFKGIVMVGDPSGWEGEDMDTPWAVMFDNKMQMYYAACGNCWSETGVAVINDVGLALAQAYPPGNYIGVDRSATLSQQIMPPVGWQKSIPGFLETNSQNFQITLDPAVTGRAVELSDLNASAPLELSRNLLGITRGVASAWLRTSNNGSGDYDLYLSGDSQSTLACAAGLGSSGTFHYWNGAFIDTAVSYAPDTWYRIEFEFDVASDTYNFVVYDTSFVELVRVDGISFGSPIAAGIDQIKLRTSNSFEGSAHVDDVVVRSVPTTEPGITVSAESSLRLTNAWARTTILAPFELGATVRWKYTAEDLSGNATESEVFSHTFVATPSTSPNFDRTPFVEAQHKRARPEAETGLLEKSESVRIRDHQQKVDVK